MKLSTQPVPLPGPNFSERVSQWLKSISGVEVMNPRRPAVYLDGPGTVLTVYEKGKAVATVEWNGTNLSFVTLP